MTTAYDIIKRSMQKAGILTKTEVPSSDEANDALQELNAMLSSWSNESMLAYVRVLENFPLTGATSYTIGPSQTFNTARPVVIISAYVRQGITDEPVEVITDEQYDAIPDKSSQGAPYWLNYSNGYPTGTIKLYPVGDSSYTLYIRSEKTLGSFTLHQDVEYPPGWEDAIVYNLAIRLAPEYGQQIDPLILELADQTKASIQRAILKNRTMDGEAVKPLGNILNGYYH